MDENTQRPVSSRWASLLRGAMLNPEQSEMAIAEWESPGDETMWIAPLHIHHEDDEIWYILEGQLIVRLDGEDVLLGPGGCATAPRGTSHSYRNPGPNPARYLLVMTDRVRRLIDAIHDPSSEGKSLKAVFAEYASELQGWPE